MLGNQTLAFLSLKHPEALPYPKHIKANLEIDPGWSKSQISTFLCFEAFPDILPLKDNQRGPQKIENYCQTHFRIIRV